MLFSDFSSSDGHTDSAFGGSIISTSPISTPVGGHSSNRLNPTLSTPEIHDEEAAVDLLSQQTTSENHPESAEVYAQEAREDEDAGYARLEDIRSAKQAR